MRKRDRALRMMVKTGLDVCLPKTENTNIEWGKLRFHPALGNLCITVGELKEETQERLGQADEPKGQSDEPELRLIVSN